MARAVRWTLLGLAVAVVVVVVVVVRPLAEEEEEERGCVLVRWGEVSRGLRGGS